MKQRWIALVTGFFEHIYRELKYELHPSGLVASHCA